jgi:hypothetical protein
MSLDSYQPPKCIRKSSDSLLAVTRQPESHQTARWCKPEIQLLSFWIFNISFEPEFGNPNFEISEKHHVFNFQLSFSQQLLILFFGLLQDSAMKPGVLNLFLSYCFLMLSGKRRFLNPAFQNTGSNPN